MLIEYINKEVVEINQGNIKGQLITYEVNSEYDLLKISEQQNMNIEEGYFQSRFFLHNKSAENVYDLVVDNVVDGRIIEGGITKENKYILSYYIIKEGIEEFLNKLPY